MKRTQKAALTKYAPESALWEWFTRPIAALSRLWLCPPNPQKQLKRKGHSYSSKKRKKNKYENPVLISVLSFGVGYDEGKKDCQGNNRGNEDGA
jgi:hypothetical protein